MKRRPRAGGIMRNPSSAPAANSGGFCLYIKDETAGLAVPITLCLDFLNEMPDNAVVLFERLSSRSTMHRNIARILSLMAVAAYVLMGLGPRGSAMCIGGSHGWPVIAHHAAHEPTPRGHCESHCADHHEDEHGPCTDIPLDQDQTRPSEKSSEHRLTLASAQPLPIDHFIAVAPRESPLSSAIDLDVETQAIAMRPVMAALRAAILLL